MDLSVSLTNLDVLPPGYEDQGEPEGDEDEEEGPNHLDTAQLVTAYLLKWDGVGGPFHFTHQLVFKIPQIF